MSFILFSLLIGTLHRAVLLSALSAMLSFIFLIIILISTHHRVLLLSPFFFLSCLSSLVIFYHSYFRFYQSSLLCLTSLNTFRHVRVPLVIVYHFYSFFFLSALFSVSYFYQHFSSCPDPLVNILPSNCARSLFCFCDQVWPAVLAWRTNNVITGPQQPAICCCAPRWMATGALVSRRPRAGVVSAD